MVKFCFIALLILTVMSCNKPKNVTVGVHIQGAAADVKPVLVAGDSTYEVVLDSTGSANILIAEFTEPTEATFRYGYVRVPLYLEANKNVEFTLNAEDRKAQPAFVGETALKNEVFGGKYLKESQNVDFKLEEQEFINLLEKTIADNNAILDSLNLGQPFTDMMKQKVKYSTLSMLGMYSSYHPWQLKLEEYTPSAVYTDYLKSLIVEDEALMKLNEYKSALSSFISTSATKDIKDYDAVEYVKAKLDFVNNNITSPKITEYLINKYVMEFVGNVGVDNIDVVAETFKAKVTDPKMLQAYDELCAQWAKIAKGQPSPDFKYLDINGKEVAMADLAGKYIYVDVWATWCGPCRGELPSLKELEHQFKGKNINFVSMSCDQDKAAWEKMVKDDKLEGIQLHMGGDQSFMDTFMIRGIPRFILIDREGKIVAAEMSRPSNSKTAETLNALEGI